MSVLSTESNISMVDVGLIGRTTSGAGKSSRLNAASVRSFCSVYSTSEVDTLLAGKANSSHTHAQSDVTGLVSALAAKADLVGGLVPSSQLPSYVDWGSISGTLSNQTDLQSVLSTLLTTTAAAAGYQPLDSDLTAIAALTTTSYGRALLTLANQAALQSAVGIGTMGTRSTYQIQVALSGNGQNISAGTKKGLFRVPIAGTVTGFLVVCDPANEPSAAAVQCDLNTLNLSTGAATSILSSVASIATGANVSTGGAISGSPSVAAGDLLSIDIDQGSDGKELVATITITAS